MVWMESQSTARTSDFGQGHVDWRKWSTSFPNIPAAGFEARAPALIGESLERCFRAQWRCYHIVSGLNGLPTVCLKDSHNDRDQLITASATHCPKSRQTLSWMSKCLCAFIQIWLLRMRVLQHTHTVSEPDLTCAKDFWVHIFCSALRMKKSLLSLHVQTQCANPIPPLSCLFPHLCKTNISKDSLVPKQSAAMGGTLNLLAHHSHPTKAGVTPATFLTTTMHRALKLQKLGKTAKVFTRI